MVFRKLLTVLDTTLMAHHSLLAVLNTLRAVLHTVWMVFHMVCAVLPLRRKVHREDRAERERQRLVDVVLLLQDGCERGGQRRRAAFAHLRDRP